MIEITNLNKYFNKGKKSEIHVINNTSLTLEDSGLVALLGESGCGKTTLLNAIGGLDKVRSGSIFINGKKITSRNIHSVDKIRNLNVGYIFQDYKLIDDMSVYDNVALALKMIGIKDKKEIKVRVEYVLDKVGILRYRYRPASTLSGGERQRVGIARALVKNPDIILADEPTGNLDSKNSVAIMNIIKRISKDRLVILVTHERKLAEFYASRVIEVVDGKVVNDYVNEHDNELDYEIDNVFYLKEFKSKEDLASDIGDIKVYSDSPSKVKLNIIVKNGNIYIQSDTAANLEVIDPSSGFEVVDDYKRSIDKDAIENFDFDMSNVGNQNIKKRYSSIYNIFSALLVGIKKVFNFSLLKKLLLVGFIFAGFFIVVSVARIGAINHVEDKDFVTSNKNYISLEKPTLSVDEFNKLEAREDVAYVLPSSVKVAFEVPFPDYYQTMSVKGNINGALASYDLIDDDDIVYGRMPLTNTEIVVDKMAAKDIKNAEYFNMIGLKSEKDILGRTASLTNGDKYTIVGIVDLQSPSIYVWPSEFYNVLSYSHNKDNFDSWGYGYVPSSEQTEAEAELTDYEAFKDKIKLVGKKSAYPENDYEVLLNESYMESYKIGKETKLSVNGVKLKVCGFYTNIDTIEYQNYFVNSNMIKYKLIEKSKTLTICPKDISSMNSIVTDLSDQGYNAYSTYEKAKTKFEEDRAESVRNTFILSGVILGISLIEMFLISRSSFLSRIKEVGTLRAIGAKKSDIYKMFIGEIFAITTFTSLPSMVVTYLAENMLAKEVALFAKSYFHMPVYVLLITILAVYVFNFVVGLIPVWNTMRKRPAQILARYDVD